MFVRFVKGPCRMQLSIKRNIQTVIFFIKQIIMAYFCHNFSDNYANLSADHVNLSDDFVHCQLKTS